MLREQQHQDIRLGGLAGATAAQEVAKGVTAEEQLQYERPQRCRMAATRAVAAGADAA